MLININDQYRIVSNPVDGFDIQFRPKDKAGNLAVDKKEEPRWVFASYHPTLDKCRKDLLQRMAAPMELDTFEKITAALNEALRILTAYDAGITPRQWAAGRADE